MTNLDRIKETALDFGCDVKENEPMKSYTTFKIGGNAQILVTAKSLNGLVAVLKTCKTQGAPCFILGRGSNLLVSDSGIHACVICFSNDFSEVKLAGEDVIFAQSGASLMKLCRFALEHSLSGLEFAYGIPGSCGGAAFMNAGAYGGEMKDVVREALVMRKDGKLLRLKREELELGYRTSVIAREGYVVLSVLLELRKGDPEEIETRMQELRTARTEKQPLEYPSAGSTFKRPEGYFAGKLIMDAGLRGYRLGGAQVSEKHCGFVINTGDATAEDVMNLIRHVQSEVSRQFGVELEMEVKTLGF